jgi:hypothetical protein
MNNLIKYNLHFLLSGCAVLLLVYFYGFIFKIPFYYFFLLPTAAIYVIGMNIVFVLVMAAEKDSLISKRLKWDPITAKDRIAKLMRNLAYLMNVLMGLGLALFMTYC